MVLVRKLPEGPPTQEVGAQHRGEEPSPEGSDPDERRGCANRKSNVYATNHSSIRLVLEEKLAPTAIFVFAKSA